ncbi:MAG: hypothetical protein WD081_05800 [Gammaproteobacteria bacterium]
MDKRNWLIAAVIVFGALAFLAYQPAAERERAPGGLDAPGIVDLPAVDAPAVATVELQPRDLEESATALVTRFERERRDAAWAERAGAEIEQSLAAIIGGSDARITKLDCRTSVCRIQLQAPKAAARPELVAAATAALQRAGHETLLEHADGTSASLVIGVRTPQMP